MKLYDIEDESVKDFIAKETAQKYLNLKAARRLYTLARKVGRVKSLCLEIGSGFGCSGIIIGTAIKGNRGKLISIDSFLSPAHESISPQNKEAWGPNIFMDNLARFGVDPTLIIGDSIEIVPLFKDNVFDLIWIDGCHEYDYAKKDILNSIPKLKEDGILCGHDFRKKPDNSHNKVKTVVEEIFGDRFSVIGGQVWIMTK